MKNNVNWEKIEKQTWNPFFTATFILDGHEISVQKESISDNKQIYSVYIDRHIKGKWNKDNFPIITKVWCKKTTAIYKPKFKKELIKIYGKKRAEKEHDLNGKIETLIPTFTSSKRWISQFKKLEGLVQLGDE